MQEPTGARYASTSVGDVAKSSLDETRNFLETHVRDEFGRYYGCRDEAWIQRAVNNWFDDSRNYDGRWHIIEQRAPRASRVLDMAAGCGTFVLYGLRHGYDVWGVEPEPWKLAYFRRKVEASGDPAAFRHRLVSAVGEHLPFPDESFDLVTSYQTIEHVQDVEACLNEMLRVLRPGGVLFIQAPDYNSFFEPHYRTPFLSGMNRRLASRYLAILGKPLAGLYTLQFVTEESVTSLVHGTGNRVSVESLRSWCLERKLNSVMDRVPSAIRFASTRVLVRFLLALHDCLEGVRTIGRRERQMSLWVTKFGS